MLFGPSWDAFVTPCSTVSGTTCIITIYPPPLMAVQIYCYREGEVWVESDAGHGYLDSSVFGPVPLENIQVYRFIYLYTTGNSDSLSTKT